MNLYYVHHYLKKKYTFLLLFLATLFFDHLTTLESKKGRHGSLVLFRGEKRTFSFEAEGSLPAQGRLREKSLPETSGGFTFGRKK